MSIKTRLANIEKASQPPAPRTDMAREITAARTAPAAPRWTREQALAVADDVRQPGLLRRIAGAWLRTRWLR